MCDVVGVMDSGKLAQLGSPEEIYEKPSSLFVAKFVGRANVHTGEIVDENAPPSGQRHLSPQHALESHAGVRADRHSSASHQSHTQPRSQSCQCRNQQRLTAWSSARPISVTSFIAISRLRAPA